MKFLILTFSLSSFLWCQITIIHAGKLICGTSKDIKTVYSILIEKNKIIDVVEVYVDPDIGKMGAEKIPAALAQTRQNMVETGASSENIAKLDELIASPDVQPAALQNSLNRLVPGSQEQVYGDMGDSITASVQ